jgi:hypothetical protein
MELDADGFNHGRLVVAKAKPAERTSKSQRSQSSENLERSLVSGDCFALGTQKDLDGRRLFAMDEILASFTSSFASLQQLSQTRIAEEGRRSSCT